MEYFVKRDECGISDFTVPDRPEIRIYSESGLVAVSVGADCVLIDPYDAKRVAGMVSVVAREIVESGGERL